MSSSASRRAIEAELKKLEANLSVIYHSLSELELEDAGKAADAAKTNVYKIIKLEAVDGLNAMKDFAEAIFEGSTLVLVKEENCDAAMKALAAAGCDFKVLPKMTYDVAVAKFRELEAQAVAARADAERKADAIEHFNFDAWKEEVAVVLDQDKSDNTKAQLTAKVLQFYNLVAYVTGVNMAWTRDDSDAVFGQPAKDKRRHIVNLAFKVVLPLIRGHVVALHVGREREDRLLSLLRGVLF